METLTILFLFLVVLVLPLVYIRQEIIDVEDKLSLMQAFNSFDKKLGSSERHNEEFSKTLSNLQQGITDLTLQMKRLENENALKEQQIRTLAADLLKIEEYCRASKNWTQTAPAFTVQLSKNVLVTAPETRIIFDKVVTNIENYYSVTDGQFRAPVKGRYVFSLTVRNFERGSVHGKIYKNGVYVAWAISSGGSSWDGTGSVSVVLDLYPNDVIYVVGNYANENFHSRSNSFSGYLLYPL